jgi:hypothetical protein
LSDLIHLSTNVLASNDSVTLSRFHHASQHVDRSRLKEQHAKNG